MPLRRLSCRLTIDFSVEVDSITEDAAHDYAKESGDPRAASDPETWAWIGMQRRLLHALVSRPDLLRRYVESEMRVVVSEEAGQWAHDALRDETDQGDFDAVWEAIGSLSEQDQLALAAPSLRGRALGRGEHVGGGRGPVLASVPLRADGRESRD